MAPCRLELTPAGPIDLPLGQMMRLQGFANYSGGRRVQVPSERLKWFSQEKSVPGLELYDNREAVGAVGALKAGAGPLNVYANYHGQESNRVTFKSVEADPNVKLDIDVDRTLRIAGESGRAVLTASGPSGDVELVPSLTVVQEFQRQGAEGQAEKTGLFATGIPGNATMTGSHLAAKEPAKKEFRVCDPAKAKLLFDPASVRVPVNQKAALAALPGGNGSRREEGETAGRTGRAGGGLLHRPAPGRAVLSADPHRPERGDALRHQRIDPRAALPAGDGQGRGGRCRIEGLADHAVGRFAAGPGAIGRAEGRAASGRFRRLAGSPSRRGQLERAGRK